MIITDATNLPRLMNCNGSRLMAAALPPDTDQSARDAGNAAHWMAQQVFNGASLDALIDTKAFNGFTMTAEMAEHVQSYVSALDCGEMERSTSWNGAFDGSPFQINGRADHIAWRCHPNDQHETPIELVIDDFKYGRRIVEPEMNWTLISHAIGWILDNGIAADATIVFRIHQPRPHHPSGKLREWRISYAELRALHHQIIETLGKPSDMLTSGIEWCAKCHALPTCPAARKARYNAIDASEQAFNDDLPDDVLAHELDIVRAADATIKAQRDALEELVTFRIRNGAVFADYGLEQQFANTRWKTGISAEVLTAATGKNCIKSTAPITPAEAKRRGISETTIKSLTERPMTGVKLVRSTADQRAQKLLGKKEH